MNEPGSRIDLSAGDQGRNPGSGSHEPKPFLGVYFKCCGVYGRVYRNQRQDAYEGRCPKCMGQITVGIGPGGTENRIFTAS